MQHRNYTNNVFSMLRDMEVFKMKLQHIDGFGDTGTYLTEIIKSKQVKSASPILSEKKIEDQGEDFFDAEKEAQKAGAEANESKNEPVDSETK